MITGSKSSVYDDKDWIRSLEGFVRECHAARRKVIGICFGHQLVAQALGGVVGKSDKGWGVGVNCYSVDQAAFDLADGDRFCLLASHQDQVMTMPPGAQRIATNDHCEVAGMTLGAHMLTFQGHPEFIPEYSREIMNFRHDMIGAERVAEGMASFECVGTREIVSRVGCWPFLTGRRYHWPIFSIDCHGSCSGSASPDCNNSIEIPSGERINAMRPSRGGRLSVTPLSKSCWQVA